MSFHHGDYESHDSERPSLPTDDEIDALAAEILADAARLGFAAAEDKKIEGLVGWIVRACMDRLSWSRSDDGWMQAPYPLFIATTALRAALFEYARKELEGKNA